MAAVTPFLSLTGRIRAKEASVISCRKALQHAEEQGDKVAVESSAKWLAESETELSQYQHMLTSFNKTVDRLKALKYRVDTDEIEDSEKVAESDDNSEGEDSGQSWFF